MADDVPMPVIAEQFVDIKPVAASQSTVADEAGYGPPDQGGTSKPAESAAETVKVEADAEVKGDPTETLTEAAKPATDDSKKGDAAEVVPPEYKRVITREKDRRKTAELALESTRQQLADALALAARYVPNPNAAKAEPKRDEFNDPDAYTEARAEWLADQKFQRAMADQSRKAQENEGQRLQRDHLDRLAAAEEKYPGIADVARDPTLPVNEAMGAAIVTSDHGPAILHYLDEHRDEAKRIYSLTPARAAAEIGKIEEKLTAPKAAPNKVSSAPRPITPVGANGTVVKGKYDPGTTDEEYFAIVEQERQQKLAQMRGNGAAR